MAVNTGAASKYCCLNVQQSLADIAGSANPENLVLETNGTYAALNSPQNTVGFEKVQTESALGKALPDTGNRTVEVAYRARSCTATTAAAAGLCDTQSTSTDDQLFATVSVDLVRSTGFRVGKEEFRQLCETPSERIGREMVRAIADLKRDINDDINAAMQTGLGNYFTEPGGVPVDSLAAPNTLFLFQDDSDGARPNNMALYPLQREYQRSGYSTMPIVVGQNLFNAYAASQNVFANNDDKRFGAQFPNGMSFFPDYRMDFGDSLEHAIAWAPGNMQVLEWYQYRDVYEEFKPTFTETVMSTDPSQSITAPGNFSFDFTMRYSECDHVWDFSLTKYFDLFKVPDDAFAAACDQDSNGCLNYLVDCGVASCNYLKNGSA